MDEQERKDGPSGLSRRSLMKMAAGAAAVATAPLPVAAAVDSVAAPLASAENPDIRYLGRVHVRYESRILNPDWIVRIGSPSDRVSEYVKTAAGFVWNPWKREAVIQDRAIGDYMRE